MTALVTGAGGFLGTALLARLLARGDEPVRAFVRPGTERALPGGAEIVEGSLTRPADCARAVAGVDVVYHLAAGTRGAPAERFANSVVASRHLLDALVAEGRPVRTVLVSSFAVYGVAELGREAPVDETTPLEPHPERRDVYAQAKLRQELLHRDYRERHGLPLVVVRPGVLYGPGSAGISARVGLRLPGLFLHLGGDNPLPLSHVENCAEALVVAAGEPRAEGEAFNAVDDDLPTCAEFLRAYRREAEPLRVLRLPYRATLMLSGAAERYHAWSRGQLPAVLTPYRAATLYGGNRFSNARLKALGWREVVPVHEGMRGAFAALRRGDPAP